MDIITVKNVFFRDNVAGGILWREENVSIVGFMCKSIAAQHRKCQKVLHVFTKLISSRRESEYSMKGSLD